MQKREIKIYCPKCAWEPRPGSRWSCGRCAHTWNTFETAATCPACGHAHAETQCLDCFARSPHRDWYHEFNSDEAAVREAEAIEMER